MWIQTKYKDGIGFAGSISRNKRESLLHISSPMMMQLIVSFPKALVHNFQRSNYGAR